MFSNRFLQLKIRSLFSSHVLLRGLFALLICVLILLAPRTRAANGINPQMNYQAKILDSSGSLVVDGTYSIKFSIYADASGGTPLWTAAGTTGAPTALSISVTNGLFSLALGDTSVSGGSQNSLESLDWNSDSLYLGITIGSDAEMTPRKRLTGVPYAFNAQKLQGMYASSTASGNQSLFTINQTDSSVATGTRTALLLQSSGVSDINDYLLRMVNSSSTVIFSINRLGAVTTTGNLAVTGSGTSSFSGNLSVNGAFSANSYVTTSNIFASSGTFINATATSLGVLGAIQNIPTTASSFGTVTTSLLGTTPYTIAVAGRYAYVTNLGLDTLTVIDVTYPTNPVTVGTVTLDNDPYGVAVAGRYAYVTNYTAGTLNVVDVSTKASPVKVGGVAVGGNPQTVAVSGRHAYVGNYASNTVSIVDVSNPLNPFVVTSTAVTTPNDLYVSGRYVYVVNTTGGELVVLDVRDPHNPLRAGSVAVGTTPRGVFVAGRYAYVTNSGSDSLSIVDISSPTSPSVVATHSIANGPRGVYVAGRYAYVTNSTGGAVTVVDVANASSPSTVLSTSVGSMPLSISVSGRYAYVVNNSSNNLSILDVKGIETNGLAAHTAEVGNLQVLTDAQVANQLNVGGGLAVGQGGIISAGALAIAATNTTSSIMGNLAVGTSTYSAALNSLFSMSGDDLFVAGNIGSVSSVYTNGAFVAGSGSTHFADGLIRKTDGNLTLSVSSGYILPESDRGISFGTSTLRFDAYLGNVTSTSATSTDFFATTLRFATATGTTANANTGAFGALSSPSVVIGGGTINGTVIGGTSPSTAIFTNVTTTNATTTNLYGTTVTTTNLFANSATSSDLFATTLRFTNATGSSVSTTNIYAWAVTTTNLDVTTIRVGGTSVCLVNGTNCPVSTWSYNAAGDFVYNTTSTSDLVVGSTATNTAPLYFNVAGTAVSSNRLIIGQNGTGADVLIGNTTSVNMNTLFQFTGDDLYVQGNIGSASSIYSNGAFISGVSGGITYSSSSITRTSDITMTPSGRVLFGGNGISPVTDNSQTLGTSGARFGDAHIGANGLYLGDASSEDFRIRALSDHLVFLDLNSNITDFTYYHVSNVSGMAKFLFGNSGIWPSLANLPGEINMGQLVRTTGTKLFIGASSTNVGDYLRLGVVHDPNLAPTTTVLRISADGSLYSSSTLTATSVSSTYVTTTHTTTSNLYVSTLLQMGGDIIAASTPTSTSVTQTTTTLESTNDVGRHMSATVGRDGKPVIAYYDETNGDLRVMRCDNVSCTTGSSVAVDSGSGDDVGQYPSIAIGVDGYPAISYYDATSTRLKFVHCTTDNCSSAETPVVLDSTNQPGQYSSLAILPNGNPIVAYQRASGVDIYVVACGTPTCSTVGTPVDIGTASDEGYYAKIAVTPDGLPVVAHYQSSGGGSVLIAKCADETCTSATTLTLDSSLGAGSGYVSLAVGRDGAPIVSYYRFGSSNNGQIRVNRCTTEVCTASSTPQTIVSGMSDFPAAGGAWTSVALAADGFPAVAYYHSTNGTDADPKLSKCLNSGCSSTSTAINFDSSTANYFDGTALIRGQDNVLQAFYFKGAGFLDLVRARTCASSNCAAYGSFSGASLGSTTNFFYRIYGREMYAQQAYLSGFDLAEAYPTDDETLQPGDVLAFDEKQPGKVIKADPTNNKRLIGAVSTKPGLLLSQWPGESEIRTTPVALAGRVPVRVSVEQGAIEIGDLLTLSSTSGTAARATKPGMVLGRALEATAVDGVIEVFINVGYDASTLLAHDGSMTTVEDDLVMAPRMAVNATTTTADSWGLTFRGAAWDGSQAATSDFTLFTDVRSPTSSAFVLQNASGTSLLAVDQDGYLTASGDVAIGGKLYPSVHGKIQRQTYITVDDSAGPSSTYISTNAGWQTEDAYDFAERYYSPDHLESGDVVVVREEGQLHVQRSLDGKQMAIGVVSTKPGFVTGKQSTSTHPIALMGRAPTKVSTLKGVIRVGDLLAPSSIPGVAVKATEAGPIVGQALETYEGADIGKIEVLVKPIWWGGNMGTVLLEAADSPAPAPIVAGATADATVQRGFAIIIAGSKKVHVNYPTIGSYPNVQVTPRGEVEGGWWTDGYTDVGFDIILKQEQMRDITFAWRVEATGEGEQVLMSDGTSASINSSTGFVIPGTEVKATSTASSTTPEPDAITEPVVSLSSTNNEEVVQQVVEDATVEPAVMPDSEATSTAQEDSLPIDEAPPALVIEAEAESVPSVTDP
jgi:hypothetical protein